MRKWKWHDIIDVLRWMRRKGLHKTDRRRFLLIRSAPQSKSTPLGYGHYTRVVNKHPSLEAGMERAKQRTYVPKVEEE